MYAKLFMLVLISIFILGIGCALILYWIAGFLVCAFSILALSSVFVHIRLGQNHEDRAFDEQLNRLLTPRKD